MTTEQTTHKQLRRAHARSEVIQANLEDLEGVLSGASLSLQTDLRTIEQKFKLYVGRLRDACSDRDTAAAAK